MKWIIEKIKEGGENTAVIFKEQGYSYVELYERICDDYSWVKETLKPGEVVAIVSDYSFESIALFFALYENRNIIVPITTKIQTEIEDRLITADCNCQLSYFNRQWRVTKRVVSNEKHQLIKRLQDEGGSYTL